MPDKNTIVIDTSSVLALIAATESLAPLKVCFSNAIVPLEVSREVEVGGPSGFGVEAFTMDTFITKLSTPTQTAPYLQATLDPGEAAVIQTALDRGISTVCIDEAAGRHVARMCQLSVTGSLGILVAAIRKGTPIDFEESIDRMKANGIWIGDALVRHARELIRDR